MTGMTRCIGALALLAMSFTSAVARPSDAMQAFAQQVQNYMELRQRVATDLPPLQVTSDWRSIQAARHALAHAVRTARAHAAPGDIFTAEAAGAFRQRIADALREHGVGVDALLADLAHESEGEASTRVAVNARFDWTHAAQMPGYIIAALPPLPDELQYRFINHHLVLLDCDAGLILDVLPQALR